jgi:hypothetical protein
MVTEDETFTTADIFRRQKIMTLELAREAYHRRLAPAERDFGDLSESKIQLLRSTLSAAEGDLRRFVEVQPPRDRG